MKKTKEEKWFYVYEEGLEYRDTYNYETTGVRYVLGEELASTGKSLICIGVNPSTAIPKALDPTVAKVQRYAKENEYAAWYMLNLYPQRATNPDDMHPVLDATIHKENVRHIAELLESVESADVWCAWGGLIEKRGYLKECRNEILALFSNSKFNLIARGFTKEGHPKHPLYNNEKFTKYNHL